MFTRALHLPPPGRETFFLWGARQAGKTKAAARVTADHLKGLRAVIEDHPSVTRRVIVCLEPKSRITDDGIEVLAASEFCAQLAAGQMD